MGKFLVFKFQPMIRKSEIVCIEREFSDKTHRILFYNDVMDSYSWNLSGEEEIYEAWDYLMNHVNDNE